MVTETGAAGKKSGKRYARKVFSLRRYLWRELWAGYFGTAPHATGHTLPLGTGTKRKREAFRTKESPNHTRSPKRASKSMPMLSQKHQRAASIHRHRMELLLALALLTRSPPKTIWFHQVTLDCQINASSSPPTLSWQFVKDSVFIKRTNAECVISVLKQQMAPVQTVVKMTHCLVIFTNAMPITHYGGGGMSPPGRPRHDSSSEPPLRKYFTSSGMGGRQMSPGSWLFYVQRNWRDDQKQTHDFTRPLSSFLE